MRSIIKIFATAALLLAFLPSQAQPGGFPPQGQRPPQGQMPQGQRPPQGQQMQQRPQGPSHQTAFGKHASDNMKIGIAGYSYRGMDLETTLQYLNDMGVHYLSVKDFWLPLDATAEQIAAFKAKCAEYDVEGYTLGPIYMRSEADVDRAFAYAQRYGASWFIGVPNYELLPYTIEKVKQTGIKVAIHTHGPDGQAFPDIRTVVEMVKDPNLGIGCCMDLGHTFRSGYDVAKDIKKYGKWIMDVHIKDETAPSKEGDTWEMGRGQMDIPSIIKAFQKIGYKGMLSIEFEKTANRHPGIAESVGYLRGVIDTTK